MNILYLKKKPFLVFLNYTLLQNFRFVALTSSEIISGQTNKNTNHCVLIYKICQLRNYKSIFVRWGINTRLNTSKNVYYQITTLTKFKLDNIST